MPGGAAELRDRPVTCVLGPLLAASTVAAGVDPQRLRVSGRDAWREAQRKYPVLGRVESRVARHGGPGVQAMPRSLSQGCPSAVASTVRVTPS